MTSDEVRASFLNFFASQGHLVVPSSSLIPRGDPTLLLTTAGMVQFKPYYLGAAVPPSRRLTSCQKCFRTTDIESVGDSSHLTFFEMLGNFSIGDYFKKEAINWAWEFVTRQLKLPPERLRTTIYLDDEEAFGYWRELGIPGPEIIRLGEKDNFWGPAGRSGPCGPCSEIHFDFGAEFGCQRPGCAPGCPCGRFLEIWNLVFVQYNQDESGRRTPLPLPSIDTGMGLERLTAAVNGQTSVYQTDVFQPLLARVSELTGKQYGKSEETDRALRVVAEHGRGITFLIGDGVLPSNEGRGYVLRRLLRRAALFGRRVGLDKPFLTEMARTTVERLGPVYPELVQRRDFILKTIELEEARFSEALTSGLELLENIIALRSTQRGKQISGQHAFRLYDTYGFPVELTKEVASSRGLTVDLEGFQKEMESQRERARAAHKFGTADTAGAGLAEQLNVKETPFVGYETTEHQSVIIHFLVDHQAREMVSQGQKASLILETTPFYGEKGGQVGDTGEITGASGRFVAANTVRMPPDIIVHQGYVAEGSLAVGDSVTARVDRERRRDIARNHTATHLLQAALRQVLGEHVQQKGSLVAPERFRFDFSHLEALKPEELQKVQGIVNERIRQNLPVQTRVLPYKEAVASGAIALFEEEYGETVRVLRIGEPPVSTELCGGTHVSATGEIGFFIITSETSIGAGLRRIEAVTGRGAEAYIHQGFGELAKIAEALETKPESLLERATSLAEELKEERRLRQTLEGERARRSAETLLSRAEVLKGVTVLAASVPSTRSEILREMGDFLRDKLRSAVIVLGTVYEGKPLFLAMVTPDLVAKGYHAGNIIKQVARVAGGGGGGKAELAQAGGRFADKLDQALGLVKSLI